MLSNIWVHVVPKIFFKRLGPDVLQEEKNVDYHSAGFRV